MDTDYLVCWSWQVVESLTYWRWRDWGMEELRDEGTEGWRDWGMEELRDGGTEEWRNWGMEELRDGETEGWRNWGWRNWGMERLRDGGIEGWRDWGMETYILTEVHQPWFSTAPLHRGYYVDMQDDHEKVIQYFYPIFPRHQFQLSSSDQS